MAARRLVRRPRRRCPRTRHKNWVYFLNGGAKEGLGGFSPSTYGHFGISAQKDKNALFFLFIKEVSRVTRRTHGYKYWAGNDRFRNEIFSVIITMRILTKYYWFKDNTSFSKHGTVSGVVNDVLMQ